MNAVQRVLVALEAVNESKEQHLLALHLSATLAAVVRAANRRLWWQIETALGEDADGNDASQQTEVCVGCRARREEGFKGPYAPSHRDGLMSECPMLETDASLDAFEAAAKETLL